MTAGQLFELADDLTKKPRSWVESGPVADGSLGCVMFLGFERALRQYSAIVELLRKGLCDDALVLVRPLYELNVNLHAIRSEQDAEKFIRFGRFQQARLIHQRLEDELKDAEETGNPAEIKTARSKLNQLSLTLDTQFAEFKLAKGGWQKSLSGKSVEALAQGLARDTGAPRGRNDYWIFRLGSLFTHNEPGALVTGVNENKLSPEGWSDLRARRDQGSKQGLSPILHQASICFIDIAGMAGPCIHGYERPWFDDAMQKILPALCDGDTTENLKR